MSLKKTIWRNLKMGEEATYHLAAILEWCRCGRGWEPSETSELGHRDDI